MKAELRQTDIESDTVCEHAEDEHAGSPGLRSLDALRRERDALQRLFRLNDYERRLIGHEIHDTICQQLAAATMQFQAHEHLRATEPDVGEQAYREGIDSLPGQGTCIQVDLPLIADETMKLEAKRSGDYD